MKQFMDKDFLLSTPTAQHLFHDYADKMPIVDYHCHINPKEIAEDRKFENITQVWLGGDHYKWRQMRTNGVDEKYITGDASDREKFQKWAETLEMAIGNPLYHWSHLELQRYFGYNGVLNGDTAEEVWNLCNAKLQEDSMSVRNLIRKSNVTLICTTDDPVDSLEWHKVLAEDDTFEVKVLPAWRPDKAMNIEKPEYLDYLKTLSDVSGITVNSFASFVALVSIHAITLHRGLLFSSKNTQVSAVDENPIHLISFTGTLAFLTDSLMDCLNASSYRERSASTSPLGSVVNGYSLVFVP